MKTDWKMFLLMVCALMAPAWGQEFEPMSFLPPNPYTTAPGRFDRTIVDSSSTRQTYKSGKYLLTAPQTAIPGFNFTLMFEWFMDQPVRLQARIYSRTYDSVSGKYVYPAVVTTSGSFVKGQAGVLDLPIPANLMPDKFYSWEVGCDTCTFLNTGGAPEVHATKYYLDNYLSLIGDVTTIMIQTDKAIYKPGHIVHFRVFAVYPDLKMYTGTFQIEIRDPNNNNIQRLSEASGRQGVVEGSLALADKPLFGDWTIAVQIQTTTRTDYYSKTFTVQEYNLPRFEVLVDVPSYVLTTDEDLKGLVKAIYTFGQPVKGLVELRVSSTQGLDYCGKEPRFMQIAFDIDGEAKFSVPRVDIARVTSTYDGASIKVTAIVKETLTDVKLQGSAVVTYRSTPYKVTILDNTPGVFKPGLPFSVFAKASLQDDKPVVGIRNMTIFLTVHYNIPADNSFLYGVSQFTGTYPLPVRTIDVPAHGVVKIDIEIPSNATSLDVTVDFNGVRATKYINKMFSASGNYLQLTLLDQNLQSGQTARVQARATEVIGRLSYQILSRGIVYESKTVEATGQYVMTINIPLTPDLAPTAHMVAYYVRPDLEIVADSIAFNVDGVFKNKVSLELSTNRTEPHTDLEVHVTADPDSTVYLLAVDQSALLLKTGNDVTPRQVEDAVGVYDQGTSKPSDSAFALSLSRQDIGHTMQEVGIKVFSDANLFATSVATNTTPYDPSINGPVPTPAKHKIISGGYLSTTDYFSNVYRTDDGYYYDHPASSYIESRVVSKNEMVPGSFSPAPPQTLKEVERVRNLFPETWLWLNQTIGINGSATIHTTVPDTITSWITTAFASNLQSGLGVGPSPAKLTVFRSFFVSLTLPTSVIRGEYVVVQASVFNYLPSDIIVVVKLPASNEYASVTIGNGESETVTPGDQERTVNVKSNEQAVVYFPIIPTALGAIDIEVSARSSLAADAERRQLIVEAEGMPGEFNIPVFINLGPNGTETFSQTFPVTVPDDVVSGSSRSRIKVTGDILGPSVDGLERLLRMPIGCGEQNMVTMAPNLYIANYLKSTGQITPELAARIKYLLETGYQRQLTYQRQEGAFSTFGNRDNSGNTWLTAFVLRVFHEARSDVYVDSAVLQRAMDWLTQRQNTDGSFNEFGQIFDPQMKQFGDHSIGLTAFVLLALMENADVPTTAVQTSTYINATSRARTFLETHHVTITDDLSLALTTLALVKVGSPSADQTFARLMEHSITENGMTFWKSNQTVHINPFSRWKPSYLRARPIDIHITSYGLLVFAAKGLFKEGMSILHWLTSQRNPYGGFASTQDTIVGLQAMTEFLKLATLSGFSLGIDIRAQNSEHHFDVDSSNNLVLQTKELTFIPPQVTFEAKGKGLAVAEFDVFFNTVSDFGEPAFGVSTVLLDDYLNSFKLMTCTRWLLPGESGMVVQEVGIPSGFTPDMTSVGNVAGLKRVERRGRYLDVYFDKITRNSLCYTIVFDRQDKVAHSQPSYVITQDYYEPNNRAAVRYHPLSLRDAKVCDVCRDCC